MNAVHDTVQSRRLVARSLVPSNVKALESKGLEVSNLDGIEYRVADRVAFFPKNGFWRFLDGSRQGYGASRLIPALSAPAPLDPMVEKLRKPRKNSEKPAAGRDNVPAELEAIELHQHVEFRGRLPIFDAAAGGVVMNGEITTLEEFQAACEHHDLTYSYSDDGRWWRAGCESHERIKKAAEKFPRDDVERIWNSVVDTKVVEGARGEFYWKWPKATDGSKP